MAAMEDDPRALYAGCIDSFIARDYDESLQQGLNSLSKSPRVELFLLIIMNMLHLGMDDLAEAMGERARTQFSQDAWAQALVKLILGETSRSKTLDQAKTSFQRCQCYFYSGAVNLLHDQVEMALQEFYSAAVLDVNCLESDLADAMIKQSVPGISHDDKWQDIKKYRGEYGTKGGFVIATPRPTPGESSVPKSGQPPSDRWAEIMRMRWGRVRVFISSTFKDMQSERDLLVKRAFPELRRRCASNHLELVEVDLRWGITDERRGEVLDICLSEIDQSDYLVGMLGQRYGWVPEDQLDHLLLLHPWLEQYTSSSVTEIEILYALRHHSPTLNQRSFFYFREPVETGLPQEVDPRLFALKETIIQTGCPTFNYAEPEAVADIILNDLWSAIQRDYPVNELQDPYMLDLMGHAIYAQEHLQGYLPRPGLLEQIDANLETGDQPLVIVGDPGSGKTSLLTYWVHEHRQKYPDEIILEHYVGATESSTYYKQLIRRVGEEIQRHVPPPAEHINFFKFEEDLEDTGKLLNAFQNSLALGVHLKRLILVLDGCDQLDPVDNATLLGWLPEKFFPHISVLLSTRPGPTLEAVLKRGWNCFELRPFSTGELKASMVEYLRPFGKQLNPRQLEKIAASKQAANPLFLHTLLNELRLFGDFDRLDEFISSTLQADTSMELYLKVLDRIERDNDPIQPGVVNQTLALITTSRTGLTETELLELLGTPALPLPRACWSGLYLALQTELINRFGQLSFLHADFHKAVTQKYLSREGQKEKIYLKLADYYMNLPLSERKADLYPWHLYQAKQWELLKEALCDLDLLELLCQTERRDDLLRYWSALEQKYDLPKVLNQALEQASHSDMPADRLGVHYFNIAGLLEQTHHLQESEILFRKCIKISIRELGNEHPSVAVVQRRLGMVLVQLGNLQEGKELVELALRSMERSLGPMHPSIAATLLDLGNLYEQMGKQDLAMNAYSRALEIRQVVSGYIHLETAVCLTRLAILQLKKQNYDQAFEICEQVRHIHDQLGQPDHPNTYKVMDMLAEIYRIREQYPQAEAIQRTNYERRMQTLGLNNRNTAMTLGRIGLLRILQKDVQGGLPLCQQALAILEQTVGPDHPDSVEIRKIIQAINE